MRLGKIEDKQKIELKSEKVKRRERRIRELKTALLILLLCLIIIYFLLRVIYATGNFTISLDPNFDKETALVMYEKIEEKNLKKILEAGKLEYMDNISEKWLPKDIHNEAEGSHNGTNYIAYTFYVENRGSENINYWYTILIDDIIKEVDEAIRVMIYRNDEKIIYARPKKNTNEPEEGTEVFFDNETVMLKQRKSFQPGEIDKFTIVIWLEGDDLECVDSIIGGEMKMHMEITEEHENMELLDKISENNEQEESNSKENEVEIEFENIEE